MLGATYLGQPYLGQAFPIYGGVVDNVGHSIRVVGLDQHLEGIAAGIAQRSAAVAGLDQLMTAAAGLDVTASLTGGLDDVR